MRRSDWERVTERDELVGRLSLASRLPQYLETAMVGQQLFAAVAVVGHDPT